MKNGKRLTRSQKLLVASRRLDPNNWLVCKALPHELHLVHRHTSTTRIVKLKGAC